jgi:hypothetical protein
MYSSCKPFNCGHWVYQYNKGAVRFKVFTAVTMKDAVFWDINPIRTSQETHYISATGPSRLILCKIFGFHGGEYEECGLLGCYAVWLL